MGRLLPADAGVYGAFPRQRDDNYVHTTFTDEFFTVLGGGLSVQHPGMTARVCSLGQVSKLGRGDSRKPPSLAVRACLGQVSEGRQTHPVIHTYEGREGPRSFQVLSLLGPIVARAPECELRV